MVAKAENERELAVGLGRKPQIRDSCDGHTIL